MAATSTQSPAVALASISITDHTPNPNNNLYDITFDSNHLIVTTVTAEAAIVTSWIATLQSTPRIIGLDVEWRPNRSRNHDNPVATLQLCTKQNSNSNSYSCLIFQIIHAEQPLPKSLIEFLTNDGITFVGAGIQTDVERLLLDYDLSVSNTIDLSVAAKDKNIAGLTGKSTIGLKELAKLVLGVDVAKPKSVTMSRWDQSWLTHQQIQYAAIDAFLSYQIASRLLF